MWDRLRGRFGPSTREPDLDNANGGMLKKISMREAAGSGRFPFLFLKGGRMVKINGEMKTAAGQTLGAVLLAADYDRQKIAVERNGAIVPKAQYDETVLEDGDVLEVVSFVGGG